MEKKETQFSQPILDLFVLKNRLDSILNSVKETNQFLLTDLKYIETISIELSKLVEEMKKFGE